MLEALQMVVGRLRYVGPVVALGLTVFASLVIGGGISYALTGPLVLLGLLYLRRTRNPAELQFGALASVQLYLALGVMLIVGFGRS